MRILTGFKPTGKLHLGNYFSCIKPVKELGTGKNFVECLIADLHALNTLDQEEIDINTSDMFEFLSRQKMGMVTIQKNKHATYFTFLEMLQKAPKGLLERCHAYKSLDNKDKANMGLFVYPVLMAVDIYLSGCDTVLVGEDQIQHVEVARDLIKRYNKDALLPEALIVNTENILGFDGKKMSKSYNNTLYLDATNEDISRFVKKIKTSTKVTDKGSEILINLFQAIGVDYEISSYGKAKKELTKQLIDFYDKEIR